MNRITDQTTYEEYLNGVAATVSQLAADYYLKKLQENNNFRPESVRREDLLKSIQLYKDFPEIEVAVFALTDSKIPDFNLYYKTKNNFMVDNNTKDLDNFTEQQEVINE